MGGCCGQCPAVGARQHCWCASGEVSEQVIQVIQVVLVFLSQRFLATIKVVQFPAMVGQVVPAASGPA
jgi:hypothetical protein